MMHLRFQRCAIASLAFLGASFAASCGKAADDGDPLREAQNQAVANRRSPLAHWGTDPNNYTEWGNHSNRLVPIYCFGTKDSAGGTNLDAYTGTNSGYRDSEKLRQLYGRVPEATVNPEAEYCDQTDLFAIQKAALAEGRRYIFLVIFDGMSWHATRAAAVYRSGRVYREGKGSGLFFLDYVAPYDGKPTNQFGFMATSPYGDKPKFDLDAQTFVPAPQTGGYDAAQAGPFPWSEVKVKEYLIGKTRIVRHSFTDSSSSATSMTAGIKTFNGVVNLDHEGKPVTTIAHLAQAAGYAVGSVTSVAISHATPACTYAHNVYRTDYQDLTRDMLGLPSISHPKEPLPGMDVVLGTGFGEDDAKPSEQGSNVVPGNTYLAAADLAAIDVHSGGKYVVRQRTSGRHGSDHLLDGAREAASKGQRLFGYFGTRYEHLPYETANGDFRPAADRNGKAEEYSADDINENPSLADMTEAALMVLGSRPQKKFWLMMESGDVDFAKHQNNLDNMIGAIHSGDRAVEKIARWVEKNSNWKESLMIITADHGHYLVIDDIEALARMGQGQARLPAGNAAK